MKEEQDYLRDITEIRSMMERSSKFLSLAGWAGIMAGIYALAGAYIASNVLHFNPDKIVYHQLAPSTLPKIILLATIILVLAIGTAIFLSYRKIDKKAEKAWSATTRQFLVSMAVPLVVGGLLILVLVSRGLIGLLAPLTLIFYGLALYNASKFTYREVGILGLTEMGLGLLASCFVEYGLLFWALGFGGAHIVYGIYMHYRYER